MEPLHILTCYCVGCAIERVGKRVHRYFTARFGKPVPLAPAPTPTIVDNWRSEPINAKLPVSMLLRVADQTQRYFH